MCDAHDHGSTLDYFIMSFALSHVPFIMKKGFIHESITAILNFSNILLPTI